MASQEHLRLLTNDDDESTSSSGSSSSSSDGRDDAAVQQLPSVSAAPVKMRIKLSLRMPTKDQDDQRERPLTKSPKSTTGSKPTTAPTQLQKASNGDHVREDHDDVVDATIVHSSDEEDDDDEDVQAAVVESSKDATSAPSSGSKTMRPPLSVATRPVRLPPMSSPGLLLPPSAGVYRGHADANGFTTPASVFDYSMSTAGYTNEGRTTQPHRGSSVQRVVGDMFDSNVIFTLHFPTLVPKELWNPIQNPPNSKDDDNSTHVHQQLNTNHQHPVIAKLLVEALSNPVALTQNGNCSHSKIDHNAENKQKATSRKRRRPWHFSDMVPLSLTLPYPESYIQKRLRYMEQVDGRERAIVASQEAAEEAEEAQEQYEELIAAEPKPEELPAPPPLPVQIPIPPIPEPPSPPRISDMQNGMDITGLDDSKHPLYFVNEKFVAHLDPSCFHITEGRYYGLQTNSIADPHFVGPNAPGIAGLTVSGGTGLATSYIGNSSSGGSASALSASIYGSVGGGSNATPKVTTTATKTIAKKVTAPTGSMTQATERSKQDGPSPTSTATDLKKLMELGGDEAEEMKETIIRAAVFASRSGKHGRSFVGSNGETYPDISKAFAAHAGLRPCNRCKNNKQGAYHCRLRRKHKELDYDGGNSPAILLPLFSEPLDDLIVK